tara:strand:+ start:7644 stop:8063 length:420 start_codon:yes stop_codon:yes gene_type:complete
MKASDFKNIIKEAVREAIREELSEMQQPVQEQVRKQPNQSTGNPILDALNETKGSMTSEDYKNIGGGDFRADMAKNFNRSAFMPQGRAAKPISDDPQAVAQAVAAAPKVGLDLSQLGFINKAAAIVNTADKKQKEKFNV